MEGNECCRYSGSPIAMSFSEAGQQKSVVIVEFESAAYQHDLFRPPEPQITLKEIPQWQKLEQIRGDADTIRKRLAEIKGANENVLLEIQLIGDDADSNATGSGVDGGGNDDGNFLDFQVEIDSLKAEILEKRYRFSILASRDMRDTVRNVTAGVDLTEVASLKPMDVFMRKLEAEEITGAERETFAAMFKEIEELSDSGSAVDVEA
jgi:DNA repair exonuclease SbcCD nuclease subunit